MSSQHQADRDRSAARAVEWKPVPGLYRLFEVGHVIATGPTEFRFESAGLDSAGVSLIKIYWRKVPADQEGFDL